MVPTPIREVDPQELREIAANAVGQMEPAVARGVATDLPVVEASRHSDAQLLNYLSGYAQPVEQFALHAPEHVKGKFGYGANLNSFNFARIKTTFQSFVSALAEGKFPPGAIAVQGVRAKEAVPGFDRENFLPFAPAGGEYRLWLGTQAEVAIHSDPAPNIAYVACGRRRFTLFAPEEIGNLYLGPFDPAPNGTQISLADPLAPDEQRFPRFGEALARSQFAELGPGDAIFIPTGWYHHVQAFSPINLLVNYWWQEEVAGPSPWDALMHGFMALRPLSPADRRMWRAMFAHYIFEENGEPGGHMPPESRGIMGKATPGMIEAMRRKIVQSLSTPPRR